MTDSRPTSGRHVSFRTKLAVTILLACLLPMVTASVVAFVQARRALVASAEARLVLMRDAKMRALTSSFERVASNLRLLGSTDDLRQAIVDGAAAWQRLPEEMGWPQAGAAPDPAATKRHDDAVRALSQLYASLGDEAGALVPTDLAAQAAQTLFLVQNPHPAGSRHLLDRPTGTATALGDVHARIHPHLTAIVKELGYRDLSLVAAASGRVIYSHGKQVDLGASVREGALAGTGFARAARRALEAGAADAVVAEDFEFYAPAEGAPTAFVAVPVHADGRVVGAVVAQLSGKRIDTLLAPEAGASRSTDTYLVGADRKLRSQLQFEEAPSVLRRAIDTFAAREALAGNFGVAETTDYRGVETIVAYGPVEFLGLRFGLVRKADADELLEPVTTLMWWMAGLAVSLVALAAVVALRLSASLSRPVAGVTARLQTMAQSLLSTAQAQQAGAAESAAAVEETRQTFTGVLSAAQNLKTVGTEVLEHAEVAQRTAQTIGRRIQELSQNTAHIGEILALVKEIANRSDLLSLNAALEGTKAGEAGRGFSLVATQMQRLAEEVMGSVKKIEGLTHDITRASSGAVLAAEEATKVASRTTGSAQHIAEAVQTQQAATEQVSVAMNEIATVAQGSVDAARGIVGSSNDLLGLADELRRVMGLRK